MQLLESRGVGRAGDLQNLYRRDGLADGMKEPLVRWHGCLLEVTWGNQSTFYRKGNRAPRGPNSSKRCHALQQFPKLRSSCTRAMIHLPHLGPTCTNIYWIFLYIWTHFHYLNKFIRTLNNNIRDITRLVCYTCTYHTHTHTHFSVCIQ